MSVPRLARLRPGPGERDVTTSIDRQQKTGRGAASEAAPLREEGKRGGDNRPEHGPALQPRHVSPSLSFSRRGGRRARSAGSGLETYRSRRAQARGVRLSLARPGRGGVRLRVAAEKLPGTPPRRPITRGQRAHSHLVVQNANFRQNMDGARCRGPLCTDHAALPEASRGHQRPHGTPSPPKKGGGGGGKRKGRGYLVDPPTPKPVKSVPRTGGSKRRGPGRPRPHLTTWHARATARSNVLPNRDLEKIPRGA